MGICDTVIGEGGRIGVDTRGIRVLLHRRDSADLPSFGVGREDIPITGIFVSFLPVESTSFESRLGICEAEHIEEVDRDLTRRQFGIEEPLVLTFGEDTGVELDEQLLKDFLHSFNGGVGLDRLSEVDF